MALTQEMTRKLKTKPGAVTTVDSPLHDQICELVVLARHGSANNEVDVVSQLVSAARWNPAMLQAAEDLAYTDTARTVSCDDGVECRESTLANLRGARRIVRNRTY
ncbi:MAG: hypothetical protein ACI91O_000701 [Candidatus Poriferisodalaceae bacterium]|jgi:hypothetical protein